jgi:hypothetical protein
MMLGVEPPLRFRQLIGVMADAIKHCERACAKYGRAFQIRKVQEEMGELQVELARENDAAALSECADVVITAMNVGVILAGSHDKFAEMLKYKVRKMRTKYLGDEVQT